MGFFAALRTCGSALQLAARSPVSLTGIREGFLNEPMPIPLKPPARVCCLSGPKPSEMALDVQEAFTALRNRQLSVDGSSEDFNMAESVLESESFRRELVSKISQDEVSDISRAVQLVFELPSHVDLRTMSDAILRAINHHYLEEAAWGGERLPIAQYLMKAGVAESLAMLIEINMQNSLMEKERSIIKVLKKGRK